jgi:DTW domain-containing protein YfiP
MTLTGPSLEREPSFVPRAMCTECERPLSVCLCAATVRVPTRTRVVILQHPRESSVPINTARIAERALPNSERHVGVEFEADARVRAALADPKAPAVLLYPGPGARDLEREPPAGPVTLTVIDGTWWQAQKLLKRNAWLGALPRYAFSPDAPSRYRIRREPAAHCVSTIEAIVSALRVLEGDDGERVARLLEPFDAMVEHQLRFAVERRAERHIARKKGTRPRRFHPALLERASDLVVGYGEANAWPRDTPLGAGAELVHFAAERVLSGERFEAFIAPRRPFSPSFVHHTGIGEDIVRAGGSFAEFAERWQAFVRPTDLLGGWGFYWAESLALEGLALPEHVDLRVLARRHLKERTGDVLDCAAKLDEPLPEPWTLGRTGQRAAGAVAVARALMRAARSAT